jgi:hypothetical protein
LAFYLGVGGDVYYSHQNCCSTQNLVLGDRIEKNDRLAQTALADLLGMSDAIVDELGVVADALNVALLVDYTLLIRHH